MIKKLRKFENTRVLCVTKNENLYDELVKNLASSKELIFMTTNSIEEIENSQCDILIVDYCCDIALNTMKQFRLTKPTLPKIVILNNESDEDIINSINAGGYSILSTPVNYNDLKLSITMALNQSKRVDKVILNEGIYFDSYRERFYNDVEAIEFTKFEYQVLKLLLDNSTRTIGYEEIKEKVWKEKKMSIFTMRNVINKIRKKTYYGVIKNNSSSGYQIDTLK